MITRNFLITFAVLLAGLTAGYFAARLVNDSLDLTYVEKDLSELTQNYTASDTGKVELSLRIVDLGGVGVLPDTANWGRNYEHNQHYFEDVMLVNPPFIDSLSFTRERKKLGYYCGRMARFGYNSIAMPWFLEFINFDYVVDGQQVYGKESVYRLRHNAFSRSFSELMQVAADSGLSTYLWTDMVALTTPLKSYFEDRFGSADTEAPLFWEVYGKAAEEAFEKFPNVDGIIIRIGEAGSLYNKPGWDYTSELYVRSEKAVRLMLEAFLTAAEKYNKTIIFRTWSVGIGEIGEMHTSTDTYQQVLGDIQSDHLLVSSKYCSGDFYSWLKLNPTLYHGDHRRIIEFQAKREFEGFGAIPNYVAPLYQSALQSLSKKNPRLEGAWVWTQSGGPLRAGPMIIYPFHGFNVINDVNVYSLGSLFMNPYVKLDSITTEWIKSYFGSDTLLIENLTAFLNRSYDVMRQGLYISEFAKYDVRLPGLELPPMLWIFEWDILGASSTVFSNIYFITRDHLQEVIDEGFEAVKGAIALKDLLLESRDRVSINPEAYDQLIASIDYEIELFRLLDYYRQFFMNYYHWIETGDANAKTSYQLSLGQFKAVMNYYEQKYGGNLNTLGMDFDEVRTGLALAEKTPLSVRWAKVLVVLSIFLLILGIPGAVRDRANRKFAGSLYFDAIFRPAWISSLNLYHGTRRLGLFLVLIYLLGLGAFSAFSSRLVPICIGGLGLIYVVLLAVFINKGRDFAKILLTLMGPKVLFLSLILVVVAIRGPFFFWYLMWTSELFRVIFIVLFIMLLFRKFQIYIILSRKWSKGKGVAAASLVFMTLGIQLLLVGMVLKFFGLEESLTALNNELLLLPGGLSKIMGITNHLGIPLDLPLWIICFASGLVLVQLLGYLLIRKRMLKKRPFGIR